MSTKRRELLMCVLHRAGKPLTSGEVEEQAVGLAMSEEWAEREVDQLTRKSVSGLLVNLEKAGRVAYAGEVPEGGTGRLVPTYKPLDACDPNYPLPEAPQTARLAPTEPDYSAMNKSQLITLLDVHGGLAECHARFMADLERWRDRSRSKLAGVGLDKF